MNAHFWPWQVSWADRLFFADQAILLRETSFFARRPVMLFLIELWHQGLAIPRYIVFQSVNALSLFVCLVMIHRESERARARTGLLSQLLFVTSYTIFFAFLSPMDTFSEFFQYAMLLIGFFLLETNPVVSTIALMLACLERENSMFMLPALLWLGYRHRSVFPTLLPFYIASGLGIFWYLFGASMADAPHRFQHFGRNFADVRFTVETILSVVLALGIPGTLALRALMLKDNVELDPRLRAYLEAFLITVIVTIPLTLVTGLAREARLFALPLIFIWPIAGCLVDQGIVARSLQRPRLSQWLFWIFSMLLALVIPLFEPTRGVFPQVFQFWALAFGILFVALTSRDLLYRPKGTALLPASRITLDAGSKAVPLGSPTPGP